MIPESDDELLDTVRRLLRSTDPMPIDVVEMALAVPSLARFDADVVELLEAETSLIAVRDGHGDGSGDDAESAGPLVFHAASLTAVVDLAGATPTLDIVGEVAGSATVDFQRGDGEVVAGRRVDGLYRPTELLAGPVRILIRQDDAIVAVSEWFNVSRSVSDP